jgi:6-phosphogluconolactonase
MTNVNADVHVVSDAAQLAEEGARLFAERASEAIAARGLFRVALSGGSTPRALYQRLAQAPASPALAGAAWPIDWSRVHLFFGDERHVPPDHPDSNYRMVKEALLTHAPIPEANVHRIKTEMPDASAAAEDYEQVLRESFRLQVGEWPRFDLALLGMGPDGHTASLFPWTPVLHERSRSAAAVWVPSMQTWRVTLTPPVFNHARSVLFLVSGAEKAETLHDVLEGPLDPERLPVQLIAPTDDAVRWLVDPAAASRLTRHRPN